MSNHKPNRHELREEVLALVMQNARAGDVEFCWERDAPIHPWPEGDWRWVCSVRSDRQDFYVSPNNQIVRWQFEDRARVAAHFSSDLVDPDKPNKPLWIFDDGRMTFGDESIEDKDTE